MCFKTPTPDSPELNRHEQQWQSYVESQAKKAKILKNNDGFTPPPSMEYIKPVILDGSGEELEGISR